MRKISIKAMKTELAVIILFFFSILSTQAQSFIEIAEKTGVSIRQEGNVKIWEGPVAGKMKPVGPLSGKKVGILVASEFSDFQAYYMASYVSEFGGEVVFLIVDWIKWKFTRPNIKTKGIRGMWDLSLDPKMPVMDARNSSKSLDQADPNNYDALVVLGGYSADIMMTDSTVIDFIKAVNNKGGMIGAIGSGSIPLITADIMNGKVATGDNVVSFMLKKIGTFKDIPVVRDGQVITARNTVNTPDFVRELGKTFDTGFKPERKGILKGKRILIIAGEDYEDIEVAVSVMEYIYRGAKVTLATFPPPMRSRPPMLGLDVVQGNFGTSVPLQEISLDNYQIVKLAEIQVDDYDVIQIPGAFCPWNMIAAGEPIEFLKKAHKAGKIIAPICHGQIAVAAADLVKNKTITGWLACKDAVRIMGGNYNFNYSAVIDGQIVTGRLPGDLPEFLDAVTTAILSQ